jgi:phosphatidylinositol alpha-1,6-mannosyltransferase
MERMRAVPLTVRMSTSVHIAAQSLSPGSGGIARCARLTMMALSGKASIKNAFAVQDTHPTTIAGVTTRPFRNSRFRFASAHTAHAFGSDVVFYDFPGTARAHKFLALARKPYAVWVHGWEVWPENLRPDYAAAIRQADAVFANSHHTFTRVSESIPGLRNLHVCQLGTEWDVGKVRSTRSTAVREKIALFVGRNDELFDKGQDAIIDAWPRVLRQVPDAKLYFVGGGVRLDYLRSLAAASPAASSIAVLGYLPDAEVGLLYDRARLFVMLSRVEGFGLVYAEAMSHGVPILTSTEDASQYLNHEGVTGLSVCRDDHDTVADAIIRVLADDDLHHRLSNGAFEHWANNFSLSAFVGRFREAAIRARVI